MDKTDIYIERINRVIDYIELNLEEKIDLEKLAEIACLSKYHFHRIFYSFTKEPLYSFINRIRVERAAALLITQKCSITDIALSCGFNESSTFSRAFKKYFKISASKWRNNSKIHQDCTIKSSYNLLMDIDKVRIIAPLAVEEKMFQKMFVAYIRHTGVYAGNSSLFLSLHKSVKAWADCKGVLHYPITKDVVIYHDPKGITNEDKLRVSVGVTISDDVLVNGKIGKLCINKGKYIVCTFQIRNDEYGKAWNYVFQTILPQKGLQPDDGYCFEMYSDNCFNVNDNTTTVDICVPIKRI